LVQPSVLVRDDAPAEMVDRLRAAGLVRVGGLADERRALDDSAYALALRLYLVVGAVLLLMALGGLVVSNAVQVPARRRDAASLRVVGVPRRTVVLASVWESVVVLGAAAAAGVLAGVGALAVLLPSLDLGVTDAATVPRVLADPDVGRLVLLASAVGLVLLAVAAATAVLVVRRARGASLRETAR
jgi:ABC-type antimicrobial peptide transport system permease subunit